MTIEGNVAANGHNPAPQHDHEHGHEHEHEDKGLKVRVVYNGVTEKVAFEFSQTLGALRENAIKAFGNVPQPHLLSLFTTAGVEFGPNRDQETIAEAGIKKNEELLLRPGIVRGG
jgi:hypothetical protein